MVLNCKDIVSWEKSGFDCYASPFVKRMRYSLTVKKDKPVRKVDRLLIFI